MALNMVIEKSTGRVAFARDAAEPLMVDSLYSHVLYSYRTWLSNLPDTWHTHPSWFHVQQGDIGFAWVAIDNTLAARFSSMYAKANMLQLLQRAINAHRSFLIKENVGQQYVYDLKVDQARLVLQHTGYLDRDRYPYVRDYADLVGVDLPRAAALILFRHGQQQGLLRETENMRMTLTKRIIEASTPDQMITLQQEITAYEQKA